MDNMILVVTLTPLTDVLESSIDDCGTNDKGKMLIRAMENSQGRKQAPTKAMD